MGAEGDRDGAGNRQRQERKEGRSYHDRLRLKARHGCPYRKIGNAKIPGLQGASAD